MEISKKKKGKPCLIALVVLLWTAPVFGVPYTARDLMSLCGMQGPCADTLVSGSATQANNSFLNWSNAAGSDTVPLIGLNSSDNTTINSDSGNYIQFLVDEDANRRLVIDSGGDTSVYIIHGDDGTTAGQTLIIAGSGGADDDDTEIDIAGGSAANNDEGAYLNVNGNEHATSAGDIGLYAGNVAGGADIILSMENAASNVIIRDTTSGSIWTFQNAGDIVGSATLGGNIQIQNTDKNVIVAPFVATVATNLTPVAGTSEMKGNTIVAAAGPTAQAIGIFGTPIAGNRKCVSNLSANPLIVASMGTPVVNGGTNRTTSVPTLRRLCCQIGSSSTSYDCLLDAAFTQPTPIGG